MAASLVNEANEKWGQMIRDKNAKGLAALYTEDTQVLPTGSPPLIGRGAFEKFAEGVIASGISNAKLLTALLDPTADSVPVGGTFWERGNYTFFNDTGAVMDVGKFVVIWKKVAPGNIQLYIDIFNSNNA
ncbi:uncharacterized protein [Amphiura filiformis]|uniref:uncharacterized protein n=1 Tax=Amphiura filiformis TaxID=82378 RepID=UPI003B221B6F